MNTGPSRVRAPRVASFLALGLPALLSGCMSGPSRPAPNTPTLTTVFVVPSANRTPQGVDLRHESTVGETAVAATVDQVWAVLPGIFEQLGIETTTVDLAKWDAPFAHTDRNTLRRAD